MKALVVYPGREGEVVEIEPALSALQHLVGGYLEAVRPWGGLVTGWHAYVNEDGGAEGNFVGTLLTRMLGSPHETVLLGPVVILGDGPDGEEADVPEFVLEAVTKLRVIARQIINE